MKRCIPAARLAWLLFCAAGPAWAAPAAPAGFGASLPDILERAERLNPGLDALRHDVEGRQARVIQAGSLDDPMLRVEWQGIDRDSPSLSRSDVGAIKYTLSQALPVWGTRELRADAARADAGAAEQDYAAGRAELRYRIRLAFAEWYRAKAARALNREQETLLGLMEEAAAIRYRIGAAPQAEAIRLQAERSMLQNENLALDGAAERAAAALAAELDAGPDIFSGEPAGLPAPPAAGLDYWLQAATADNPGVLGARTRIEAAEAQRRLAALNRRPGLNIGLSAMQMDSRVENYELMLEVQLPLRSAARHAERAEAEAMLARARSEEQIRRRELERELHHMWAMQRTAAAQRELLDGTLLPQAGLTFQAALNAYRTGRGEFAALLEAQQQIRRLHRMRLDAEIEHFNAWAGLQKLTGDR